MTLSDNEDLPLYPPSTGRGAASKQLTGQTLLRPVYQTRPPGVLDFIVDNVLPGGGLPFFNVESDILKYTAPDGYIAVVTGLKWYITPQNNAIDPAQLSMRLLLNGATIQGTDTMGIGQSGGFDDLYIPLQAGAVMSVKLGRGPGVVQYQASTMKTLRANLDPNGFTTSSESSAGNENLLASLNGVIYQYDGTFIWRSYDGISFTNISTPGFTALGSRILFSFKNYLCYSDQTSFYYSVNGLVWTKSNSLLPDATIIQSFFEFNGQIYAWSSTNQAFYSSSDLGQNWTSRPSTGLGRDTLTLTFTYRCAVLANALYAVRSDSTTTLKIYKTVDGFIWTLIKDSLTVDGVTSWDSRIGFAFVSFNNQFFLAGGFGASAYRQLYSSPDCIAWIDISTVNNPRGYLSSTVSSGVGFILHGFRDTANTSPNNALYGVGLYPAIYDPELRCYCQLKGQLIKSKGSVYDTLVNPL